ncbi:hypothetical protein GCM10008013_14700 [Paenibacillus segetis]|uniref:Uncharacterized protein n=2 Tax=Paenibacillus segetis TaxID=1325360 RepID=A0ABQ1YAT6_9BACL|nr:hypothetical protein GCM10008013_14700 [Paenibacillus segetis]
MRDLIIDIFISLVHSDNTKNINDNDYQFQNPISSILNFNDVSTILLNLVIWKKAVGRHFASRVTVAIREIRKGKEEIAELTEPGSRAFPPALRTILGTKYVTSLRMIERNRKN